VRHASWRTPIVILSCGTAIVLLGFGLRQNYGLLMGPVSLDLGWGREVFAFAVALQTLVWGLTTPIAGFVADRYGPARVLAAGGAVFAAGLYLMSQASTPLDATISIGVLTGFAGSMVGFPIVLSVVGRIAKPERRSLWLGIASAGGSSGQLVLVPMGQVIIDDFGWANALVVFSLMAAIIVPLSVALVGGNRAAHGPALAQRPAEAFREASRHSGFILLSIGYFVCGFQTMFISAHLPAYLVDLGHGTWLGALALSLIGGFNIIGCLIWGHLGGRYPKKYLLCILYGLRGLAMAIFISLPISETSVIVFTSFMGLLWLGTVPLTSGLVAQIFGTQFMATLVGFTFISHQIGAFLGIYMGGLIYDATGSYAPIFWGGVIVGVLASLIHFPINDRPMARLAEPVRA